MLRLIRKFLGRMNSPALPAAAPSPPEPPKQKQYILNPSVVGIPEGVYFVVYQNEYCNSGMCLGTSLELAIYGQDMDYTLVVPVERTAKESRDGEWELKYIPKIQEAKVWNCPISEISPGSIAEPLFEEMYREQRSLDRRLFSRCERRPEDHPTLWYETGIEKVVWHRYTEIQKGRIEIQGPDTARGVTEQRWN